MVEEPVPTPVQALLMDWSQAIVDTHLVTKAYRSSPSPAPGLSVSEYLTVELAAKLREEFDRRSLVPGPALLTALRAKKPAQAEIHNFADDVARTLYLTLLHSYLVNSESNVHDAAVIELWMIARQRFERGSFWGQGTPAYKALKERGRLLGYEPEDFLGDFWVKKVWPFVIEGRHPENGPFIEPPEPAKIYAWLQVQANGHLSHLWRDFKQEFARIYVEPNRGEGKSKSANTAIDDLVAEMAAESEADAFAWDRTERVALARVELEERLRLLLAAYVAESNENRLAFLIHLFRQVMMPNITEARKHGSGTNQQIAYVLEQWRVDRRSLRDYLVDDRHGIGLDSEIADEIITALEPGFASLAGPISETWVTRQLYLFKKRMTSHLRRISELFAEPGERPGDNPSATEDPSEEADRG